MSALSPLHRRELLLTVVLVALTALAGCSVLGAEQPAKIEFHNATARSGFDYTDQVSSGIGNGNAGVYVVDFDDDGWNDVLAIGGERPALFRNANGSFEQTGLLSAFDRSFKSAAIVDYDDDGREDVLLLPAGGQIVTLHNVGGTFERDHVGLDNVSYPLGAATADYDGDGDRDLFVYQSGNWRDGTPTGYDSFNETLRTDNGYPNQLYENVDGEFHRVEDSSIDGNRWSLAASFTDLNGDGDPDIHVANDFNTDVIYINQGDGTFDQRMMRGNTARNGMASEIADVSGDGQPDVFVSNIELPITRESVGRERYRRIQQYLRFAIHSNRTRGNTLLVNQGDGHFSDQASTYGVRVGGWGWAASFADFNNDGRRDLFHTTQFVVRIDRDAPTYTYPMVWTNNGTGFESVDASERGLDEHNGRGLATLDYDRDGDQDVITANYGEQYTVYENVVNGSNSIQFRAVDDSGSTALGATITVDAGDDHSVTVQNDRTDYLSQDSRVSHVGLGATDSADLTVTWPDGTERTFEDVAANQRLRVSKDGLTTVATFDRKS